MKADEKRTSEEWMNILNKDNKFKLLDPDGWDRSNFNFSYYIEQITLEEFFNRLSVSTCSGNIKDVIRMAEK